MSPFVAAFSKIGILLGAAIVNFVVLTAALPAVLPGRRGSTAASRRQAPGDRGGGDRAEHLALVTQQSQVSDRLAAVGEHHRQVDGDPAGIVAGAPVAAVGAARR